MPQNIYAQCREFSGTICMHITHGCGNQNIFSVSPIFVENGPMPLSQCLVAAWVLLLMYTAGLDLHLLSSSNALPQSTGKSANPYVGDAEK